MKRLVSSILVFVLILALAIPVLADKNEKAKKPNPNKPISIEEFYSSLSSLLEDYGYSWESIKGKGDLTRKDMVIAIGKYLADEKIISMGSNDVPFKDIKNMDKATKEIIGVLYEKGIIYGKTKNTFNPNSKVTYGEAKMILERIENLLEEWDKDDKNIIPFKLINTVNSYQGKEGIIVREEKDKLYVAVTKEFSTPGYSMEINKIKRVGSKYEIDLSIISPKKNAILPQVITYVTSNIEIKKENLGKKPYKFHVKEVVKEEDIKKEIPFKQVKTIQSYSGKEGIVVKEVKDKILVSITKEFSTPGYAMAVENIVPKKNGNKIKILVIPPKKNSILLQVLTYKTIELEIDKDDIEKPYKFLVEEMSF